MKKGYSPEEPHASLPRMVRGRWRDTRLFPAGIVALARSNHYLIRPPVQYRLDHAAKKQQPDRCLPFRLIGFVSLEMS